MLQWEQNICLVMCVLTNSWLFMLMGADFDLCFSSFGEKFIFKMPSVAKLRILMKIKV